MDFTSLLPVTSSYCTEWQKPGHNASPGIGMLQRRPDPYLSGSEVAMENFFLAAQPMQLVAHTSQEA